MVPGFGPVGGQQKDTANKPATTQGRIYPVGNKADELVFQFNPEGIQRRRQPQYSIVGAAAADYWGDYSGPSPLQWARNPPETMSFDLLFSETGDRDVEASMKKIEKMMSPSGSNPRGQVPGPPDLIFAYGGRSWRGRLTGADFNEERHTPALKVQQLRVKIDFTVVKVGGR